MNVTVDKENAKKIESFIQKASRAGYSEDEIKREIERKYGKQKPKSLPMKPMDPTEGMSGLDKFLAGTGKAFYDIGRGTGQLAGDAAEAVGLNRPGWTPTKADIDAARLRDAPLMNTGAGVIGNIVGNIAALAPAALIPGANTIGGGAALGALTGAVQPVSSTEGRGENAFIGGVAGGAVPAAVRAYKVGKAALVDPFTAKGKERIVGNVLNTAASDRNRAVANMTRNKGKTPGFKPTAGQASYDDGIASLERTARAIDPSGFQSVKEGQISALTGAIKKVAGTPEARQAAVDAREAATNALYEQAKKAVVDGDAALDELLKRPTVASGFKQAEKIARDEGRRFSLSAAKPAQPTGVLDSSGQPFMSPAVPAKYSGQGLHDLKMGIDQAITEGSPGLGNRIAGSQLTAKGDYLKWLEQNIPEYAQARTTFADLSKPINQMDVGSELYKRFVPALADTDMPFKVRADSYAQALRNGDQLVRNVTGMKGIGLLDVMTPDQMGLLSGVADDAGMVAAAQNAGRGAGSDTVQKMAMSNLMQQAGIPNWIQSVGRVPGGWLRTVGAILYTKNDDALRTMLADVIKDPDAAAQAMMMAKTDPSKFMQTMETLAQGTAFALPSAVNAQ